MWWCPEIMEEKKLPARILLSASELKPNAQTLPVDPKKNQLGILAIISGYSPAQ